MTDTFLNGPMTLVVWAWAILFTTVGLTLTGTILWVAISSIIEALTKKP